MTETSNMGPARSSVVVKPHAGRARMRRTQVSEAETGGQDREVDTACLPMPCELALRQAERALLLDPVGQEIDEARVARLARHAQRRRIPQHRLRNRDLANAAIGDLERVEDCK